MANGVRHEQIRYPSENHRSYAETLGLPRLLNEPVEAGISRRTEGTRYARLTHLKGAEAADQATSRINSSIRNIRSS